MVKKAIKKNTKVTELIIGGKKIKIGKSAVRSTKGGSFSELIKGLRRLSKKDVFEYTLD
ncbi:hypothetical protein KBC75_02945 [Candidatus Shapirobacteria bacterium]|nr:hypothetical protein [Candidatus Shapirobacteria bacterium]